MPKFRESKRSGFTLIELLVVVVIIGILAGVSVGAYRDAQDRARNSSMISNVRSVQMGIEQWKTDFPGLPADLVDAGNTNDASKDLACPPGSTGSWKNPDGSVAQKYVPGYCLPKTPWAVGPQSATDGTWNSAGMRNTPLYTALIDDGKSLTEVQTNNYIDDGGESTGGLPPTGTPTNPTERHMYGYMYMVADAGSGRYVVVGAGKVGKKARIVGFKSNF